MHRRPGVSCRGVLVCDRTCLDTWTVFSSNVSFSATPFPKHVLFLSRYKTKGRVGETACLNDRETPPSLTR